MALHDSSDLVAESQSTPSSEVVASGRNDERQALSEMIGIVAPDLKEQFIGAAAADFDQQGKKHSFTSDSATEDCADSDDNNKEVAKSGSISDAEIEGSDQAEEDQKHNDVLNDDDDDETISEDSIG